MGSPLHGNLVFYDPKTLNSTVSHMSAQSKGLCKHHRGECCRSVRIGIEKSNTWVRPWILLI
ncbi:MAG TPA: hypothetical protein ENI73_00395 [Spirochaetes bacterium]|nr:hypothetical protein [Spirochaetota bacterium]